MKVLKEKDGRLEVEFRGVYNELQLVMFDDKNQSQCIFLSKEKSIELRDYLTQVIINESNHNGGEVIV